LPLITGELRAALRYYGYVDYPLIAFHSLRLRLSATDDV
jgi:hypothetical protein